MVRNSVAAIFFLLIFFIAGKIIAQPVNFRSLTADQGLSSYNVKKILQDKYGFIWIASQGGLDRYDGTEYLNIRKKIGNTGYLSESVVTDFELDDNDQAWIATAYGGIDVLNISFPHMVKRYKHSGKPNQIMSNWVRTIVFDNHSQLWVGTYEGISVINTRNDSVKNIGAEIAPGLNQLMSVPAIEKDNKGRIWAAIENYGLLVIDPVSYEPLARFGVMELGGSLETNFIINDIRFSEPGRVCLSTSQGLIFADFQDFSGLKGISGQMVEQLRNQITFCFYDAGSYWLAATQNGLFLKYKNSGISEWLRHDPFNSYSILDNKIHHIFVDREKNIWLSTLKGVSYSSRQSDIFRVYNYDNVSQLNLDHVYTLMPENDSLIYACSVRGLMEVNIVSQRIRSLAGAEQYGTVHNVFRIDDALMFNSEKGSYILTETGQIIPAGKRYPELQPVGSFILSSHLIMDSLVLLGSEEEQGLIVWNRKKGTVKQYLNRTGDSSGIYDNHIHNLKKAEGNKVWILSDMCLTLFDPVNETFEHHFPDSGGEGMINSYFLFDIYHDGKYLWLTSYGGGINRYDYHEKKWTAYTQKDGLADNCTYNIIPESDSVLWISTNNGISRFNTRSGRFQNFYKQDGLQSNSFDERAACKVGNKIYLGGINGFTQISPEYRISRPALSSIYVSGYSIMDGDEIKNVRGLKWHEQKFGNDVGDLTIYFSVPEYSMSGVKQFYYRIPELNENWMELTNKNSITLPGLSHGKYTLLVARHPGEFAASTIPVFTWSIKPAWFQTLWARLLFAGIFLFMVFIAYRIKVNMIRKDHEIRRKVSTDLHDDIGSTLNSIHVFSNLALMKPEKKDYLIQIKEGTHQAIASVRDMIWVLDDKQDTVSDVASRFEQFARPLAEANNIRLKGNTDPLLDQHLLSKKEKRNFYLILKESFNNAIKYANCSEFVYTFSLSRGKKISLEISDDGDGFHTENETSGNGLKNMQTRAEDMDYAFRVKSAEGKGTVLQIFKN